MKRTLSLLLAMLTLSVPAHADESDALTLFAVNVGKADALILAAGQDRYLIDTGTSASWGQLSAALTTLGVNRLTGVILTHTHDDHTGGAQALATSNVQVDAWYASAYFEGVKEKKHPAVLAAEICGQQVSWLKAGDVLPLGSGTLSVLGPMSPSETENCNSLVLLAESAAGRMLLTGDMEFPEETELLSAEAIPACQVLKVGNHGNRDATSEALVRKVAPTVAVISTNSDVEPDTPAIRVMDALRKFGAQPYLTEKAGAGVLVTLQSGRAEAQYMDWGAQPALPEEIRLTAPDLENDEVVILNGGSSTADLTGWFLHSSRGGEIFVLPEGTSIAPGGQLRVTTQSSDRPGDVVWPDKKIWHKTKEDVATLYDVYGRLVDSK